MRSRIFVLMLFAFAVGAGAQNYPSKPIRLIVPYTPGGDTDVVARLITPKLSEVLRQQVIVVTRAGTPKPIVTRLNTEIARIVNTADVRSALVTAGFDIGAGTAEDFERFVRSEIDKWRKVARAADLRVD
jgi:tripartite-type tricarboxylate transporter receptor subunit TctC